MRVYTLKDFFCETCSLQFDKKAVYDIHMSFVHKIEILVKEETEDLEQENNQNSYYLSSPIKKDLETPINCYICQANFSTQGNLKKHIKAVHEGKKLHKCSICDYSCSLKIDLMKHIENVHDGKKSHKCSICNHSFSRKFNLKKHLETVHDGKKPHKCSVCDYSCSRNATLKKTH